MHEAGVLHRDLKPSNVLVTPSGRVVILDFGLAAELGPGGLHESSEPSAVGTVAYMAPEQAAGFPVGAACDWYSVGIMLYEALTGGVPFVGTREQILAAKLMADPPPLPADLPWATDDLKGLCLATLARDPAARATALDIARVLGDDPPHAVEAIVSPSLKAQSAPLAGRSRHLAALAAAFESVRSGKTTSLLVRGRTGVGKTTLVHRFLEYLTESALAVVLSCRCRERERVPFKALDGIIDDLSRYLKDLDSPEARELLPRDVQALARVFPVLRRVDAVAGAQSRAAEVCDPRELRRRAFLAPCDLLARIGDRWPLVLFIDDLQWGDIDSAELLAEVLRVPDAPVLLLLGTYRSEEGSTSPFLQALREPQGRCRRSTTPSSKLKP